MNGNDLIKMGFQPGKWFKEAIEISNEMEYQGKSLAEIKSVIEGIAPAPKLPLNENPVDYFVNIIPENTDEIDNVRSVKSTMNALMKTPVVKEGAIMPDACPAGGLGTIPVGGVVASTEIHPGMHSADICCSVALTNLGKVEPAKVLDLGMKLSHFGGGGRKKRLDAPAEILKKFEKNVFLNDLADIGHHHFGTQGDGNHFFFVGVLESTGDVCLVTHHGSRKPGAMLYKQGMKIANNYRTKLSPETLKQNAWIPFDSNDGQNYWEALQIIRQWTKANHFIIHDLICQTLKVNPSDRFWNEHNFVFQRDDLFYHAKGATPAWRHFASDADERTMIPLNMAEPVLIVHGSDAKNGLGFSPHGAGRNLSRSEFYRRNAQFSHDEILKRETKGIDARFYTGEPDLSELPSAYKNAASVTKQIESFNLAKVVDKVMPYGCIMAGNWLKSFKK